MIGTFWNLCRACPSMPIDKNRSEYRSTYQWYEYTGPRQEVVKQAPQFTSPTATKPDENPGLKGGIQATLIHVKKREGEKRHKENIVNGNVHPEVNIKQNPIFEKKEDQLDSTNRIDSHQNRVTINPTTSVRSRNGRRDYAPSRRSKSEGPPGTSKKREYYAMYGSPSPDHAEPTEFKPEYVLINNLTNKYEVETTGVPVKGSRGNTEYRLQFAWPRSKNATDGLEELKPAGGGPRRSAFMAATTVTGQEKPPVPVHKKRFITSDKRDGGTELVPLVDLNGECEGNEEKKDVNSVPSTNGRVQFHSEYQKKFRPFSQYDYIAGKYLFRNQNVTASSDLSNGSWYGELIELRKKADEYRHRGWGTELVPQHLAEVYNKQIALWEHISHRSSLSALTLATTTQKPRALTKEEKSKENNRKFRLHEARQASVDRVSSVARRKTEKNEEIRRHSTKLQKDASGKHGNTESASADPPAVTSGRTQSPSSSGSPKKAAVASRTISSSSPKKATTSSTTTGPGPQEPRVRPTTLATNAHPRTKRDTSISARKKEPLKSKVSPAVAKVNDISKQLRFASRSKADETDAVAEKASAEPSSEAEIEPIVKSPPEPTRVKSPEQIMIKSPEPVNWTVPLDTGNTFTVTQKIPDDDVYHHRPASEARLSHHHGFTDISNNAESSRSRRTDDATVSTLNCDDLTLEKLCDKETEDDEQLMTTTTTQQVNGTGNTSITNASSEEYTKAAGDALSDSEPKSSASTPSVEIKVVKPPAQEISDESAVTVDTVTTAAMPKSERISSADVLDSGRNRFDQFWNKSTMNGKESSM